MDFHQTYRLGLTTNLSVSPPPGSIQIDLAVPRALRYRRLYLGWFFPGQPAAGKVSLSAQFLANGSAGARADLNFEWGFPMGSLLPASIPLRNPGYGAFAIPPFGVEAVPDGAAAEWPTTAVPSPDEMIVAVPFLGAATTYLVRMSAIPMNCIADFLRVSVESAWTTDGDTSPTHGLCVVAGVRSSLTPVP